MDRIDVHRPESIDFLIDAHGTDFGSHGGANAPGDKDGHHHRREFFANGNADDTANNTRETTFDQQRSHLKSDDPTNKKRENADHQQAGVADLKELVEDFLALSPRKRQSQQRAPEQNDHLSYVLEHGSLDRLIKFKDK